MTPRYAKAHEGWFSPIKATRSPNSTFSSPTLERERSDDVQRFRKCVDFAIVADDSHSDAVRPPRTRRQPDEDKNPTLS